MLVKDINQDLWRHIENFYTKEEYSTAIFEAVKHLMSVIREKSGEETDGEKLINKAFCGANPKILVSANRSDSEKNIQNGFAFLVRGIHYFARNPRAHESLTDMSDKKEHADVLINLIDFLCEQIIQGKGIFNRDDYLNRLLDEKFPKDQEVCAKYVKEIPKRSIDDVFVHLFRRKEEGNEETLEVFITELLRVMDDTQKSRVMQIINEELRNLTKGDYEESLYYIVRLFPTEYWQSYDDVARGFAENALIENVKSCGYIENIGEKRPYVGLSLKKVIKEFCARDKLLQVLIDMLQPKYFYESKFVIENYFDTLPELDPDHATSLNRVINRRLCQHDKRIYNALFEIGTNIFEEWDEQWLNGWGAPFKDALLNFQGKEIVEDDDLPF